MLALGGTRQNLSLLLPVENTLGYNPVRIAVYDRLVGPGQNSHIFEMRGFPPSFPDYGSDLARRLGIEYLVFASRSKRHRPCSRAPERNHYPFGRLDDLRLPPALPRAVLANRVHASIRPC